MGSRSGYLLMMGGGDDHSDTSAAFRTFLKLAGAARDPRIALVTTATRYGDAAYSTYLDLFRRHGVSDLTALRPSTAAEANDPRVVRVLERATAVLFTGGDQARIEVLVGSKTNDVLASRLADDGLVVAGTSAGATAMGCTMIVGGGGYWVTPGAVDTGPGLGLLPDALVDMHFTERGRFQRLLSAVALEPTHLGVGIDEDTAVLVKDDQFEVLGTGAVTVLDASAASVVQPPTELHRLAFADVRLHLLGPGGHFDLVARRVVSGPWGGRES
ncbi:MAG: cyanophycinase [Actinomycetes bacterium]